MPAEPYIYRSTTEQKIQQNVCTLQQMFFLPRRKPWILSGRCRRWWPGDDWKPPRHDRLMELGLPWFAHMNPPPKKNRNLLISHFFGDELLCFYAFSAALWKVTIPGWNGRSFWAPKFKCVASLASKQGSFDAAGPWWLMFPARLSWYFWDFHGCIRKGSKGIMSGSIQISHTKKDSVSNGVCLGTYQYTIYLLFPPFQDY